MGKAKINSKQVVVDGHLFDSKMEADYYKLLKTNPDILNIELQPRFTLLESFNVVCSNCLGKAKVPSAKTGKPIKCKRCDGKGMKTRQNWTYTADFSVRYKDGHSEVIDVKGYANDRFPYFKKMWEHKYCQELIVVTQKNGKWVYS